MENQPETSATMNSTNCQLLRTDFGHEVYDTWYLEHAKHNFEAPDFVRKYFSFYEKVLQLTKNDRILDAGCGIGSYTREFARRGYQVVGMDKSPNFLSEAQKITQSEELEIEYVLGNYNEMAYEQPFSVIFFEGSFFYASKAGLVSLLQQIHNKLTPDGRLYFVHSNPHIRKQQFPMVDLSEIQKNILVLEMAEYDKHKGGERCIWVRIDLETQIHYRCDYFNMHLPPDELKDCIVTAGFTDFDFYKKREIGKFNPQNDSGFSVVCRK